MKLFAGWFVNWNTSYCVLQLQSYALGEGAAATEPVSSFCCAARMQVCRLVGMSTLAHPHPRSPPPSHHRHPPPSPHSPHLHVILS